MTDISDLTNNGAIESADLIPMYSSENSATRSVSFSVLQAAVPTIKSVSYEAPTLTITMTDDTSFSVDIA